MGKSIKKIARIAIPAGLAYFAPGIGSSLGGSILGAGAAGSATLGNALLGGGIGALTGGGLKGALLGAASGGIGANLGSFGDAPLGAGVQGAVRQGTGLLGALGDATGITTSTLPSLSGSSGGLFGGGSSFGSVGNALIGGALSMNAQDDIEDQLMKANRQAQNNIGFDYDKYKDEAGYNLALNQGEEAINRSLAAQGGLASGRSLKAASEFNQNLANQFYNDAFGRYQAETGARNNLILDRGNIGANASLGRNNALTSALGGLLDPDSARQKQLLAALGGM